VPLLGYGAFLTAVIKFLILAFIIFLLVRAANRLLKRQEVTPAEAEEILLLREIRDALQHRHREEM
jgi:large conductance mechanosensitive channel